MNKPKGGRCKREPYNSSAIRVPDPIRPQVLQLIDQFHQSRALELPSLVQNSVEKIPVCELMRFYELSHTENLGKEEEKEYIYLANRINFTIWQVDNTFTAVSIRNRSTDVDETVYLLIEYSLIELPVTTKPVTTIEYTECTEIATFRGHTAGNWGVAFSPDGSTLASSSGDKTVKLWRLAEVLNKKRELNSQSEVKSEDSLFKTLQGHTNTVISVAFSPNGELIASVGEDRTAKLWSRDGKLLHTLKGHDSGIWSVAFSPDSQTIATGSNDGIIKLWKSNGTLLTNLIGHSAGVKGLAFAPDGKTLASASEDKTVILWNLEQSVELDKVVAAGCDWVRDYLRTNAEVKQEDRHLCDSDKNQKG